MLTIKSDFAASAVLLLFAGGNVFPEASAAEIQNGRPDITGFAPFHFGMTEDEVRKSIPIDQRSAPGTPYLNGGGRITIDGADYNILFIMNEGKVKTSCCFRAVM